MQVLARMRQRLGWVVDFPSYTYICNPIGLVGRLADLGM